MTSLLALIDAPVDDIEEEKERWEKNTTDDIQGGRRVAVTKGHSAAAACHTAAQVRVDSLKVREHDVDTWLVGHN